MNGAAWSHDKSITRVIKIADSLYFFQHYNKKKEEESNLFTIIVWNCHYLSSLSTDPGRISSSLPDRPSRPGSESAAASCTSRRSVEEQGGWGVGWWVKERRPGFRSAARRGGDAKNNTEIIHIGGFGILWHPAADLEDGGSCSLSSSSDDVWMHVWALKSVPEQQLWCWKH